MRASAGKCLLAVSPLFCFGPPGHAFVGPNFANSVACRFLPDASESFLPNLIYSVYTSPLPALMPHRLGLFLMILALGSCVDLHGGDESRQMGEQYYRLSRAALCELPLLEDTSMDAIQALVSAAQLLIILVILSSDIIGLTDYPQFFMQWFLLAFSEDKKSFEYAWSVSVSDR